MCSPPAKFNGALRCATPAEASRGFTLLELVVVIAIVAVLAAIALPGVNPYNDQKLDLAASRVADAIRYARTEALRTGEGHGITINRTTQQVTVQQYDLTTFPVSAVAAVVHPIDKQPYDFSLNTASGTSGVTISNAQDVFNYAGLGRQSSLIFDADGTPIWSVGAGPTTYLLTDATVELRYGTQQRLVDVARITGRVTIE